MATRRTREFLDGNKVKYLLISHSPAHTAQEVAAAAHVPGRIVAKTIVVKLDGRLAIAVVPATREVDLDLLCEAAGAGCAELAEPAQFADRFEGCQLGAMPPLGNLFGMDTFVAREMAGRYAIAFNAGSHTDLIYMKFADFRRLVHPVIARISTSKAAWRTSMSHALPRRLPYKKRPLAPGMIPFTTARPAARSQ